jgi:hypothetical protein
LVDTQTTLVASDWANELHPFPDGFKKIAQKFVDALRAKFPGRNQLACNLFRYRRRSWAKSSASTSRIGVPSMLN